MIERTLQGPFLTSEQAALRSGVPVSILPDRPDLLHIGGMWLPEVYFAFQFDKHGVRHDLGRVVHALKLAYSDVAIADWLIRPNPALNGTAPLDAVRRGRVARALAAAVASGPIVDEPEKGNEQKISQPTTTSGPEHTATSDQARATRPRRLSSKKRISPSGMRTARSGIS